MNVAKPTFATLPTLQRAAKEMKPVSKRQPRLQAIEKRFDVAAFVAGGNDDRELSWKDARGCRRSGNLCCATTAQTTLSLRWLLRISKTVAQARRSIYCSMCGQAQ